MDWRCVPNISLVVVITFGILVLKYIDLTISSQKLMHRWFSTGVEYWKPKWTLSI